MRILPETLQQDRELAARWGLTGRDHAWLAAMMDLTDWARKVGELPAGPELAAVLETRPDTLAPCRQHPDSPGFDGGEHGFTGAGQAWANAVLDGIAARSRMTARLQAAHYTDLAALAGAYPGLQEFLAGELALALTITEPAAAEQLEIAHILTTRLPATLAALHAGTINHPQALAIVRGAATDQVAAAVEQRVLPHAATLRPNNYAAAAWPCASNWTPPPHSATTAPKPTGGTCRADPNPTGWSA